ncbi:MAG: AzlC family ABC transporter permease, partial [Carboxydocellales bacterium]
VTDETFSVATLRREQKFSPQFMFGLNVIAFSAWNIGTWIGVFLATGIPQSLKSSMGIALYAMFIALLIPSMRKFRPVLIISILAVIINSLLHWNPFSQGLSTGWGIVISTVVASFIGAFVFPKGVA